MTIPDLLSERLILKPITINHLTMDYVNWLNDDEVNLYLESRGGYTIEKLEEYIKTHVAKNTLFWGIHLKENGKHVGNIKIDPIDIIQRSGEYGILIGDKSVWGKGIAKEASKTIIQYCFDQIKLNKITLGVIKENDQGMHLYESLGFKQILEKPNYGFYNNKNCTLIRMEICNE